VFLTVLELVADGIYGSKTQGAVTEFANLFGYNAANGIDSRLWNKINEIYLSVASNCIFATMTSNGVRDFAGTTLTIGSSGENVRYIQERINRIHTAIPYIGQLTIDGLYGSKTAGSVSALLRIFGLTDTGTVNESTWLLVNYIYAAVENNCLPSDSAASVASFIFDEIGKEEHVKVSELKEIMKRNGINVGNGPMFGLRTRRALAEWQLNQGLEPTGLPDGKTRSKLAKNCKNHR
jgi:peptidoglycan hydrolase-like protein with peptidoglycan-binding domain